MTVQKFLNQALEINNQINLKREQLESLRTIAMQCTSTLKAVSGGTSNVRGKLDSIAVRTADLEKEIEADTMDLLEKRQSILNIILLLPDTTLRYIFEERYLDGKEFPEIAKDISYSYSHTKKLHNDAISEMQNNANIRARQLRPKEISMPRWPCSTKPIPNLTRYLRRFLTHPSREASRCLQPMRHSEIFSLQLKLKHSGQRTKH